MKVTIDRLYKKLELLIITHQQTKEELNRSIQQVEELSKQLELQNSSIQQLEEKNKVLKLSSSIQNDSGDNKAAKQRINELVREIDKCIALLNK